MYSQDDLPKPTHLDEFSYGSNERTYWLSFGGINPWTYDSRMGKWWRD